MAFPTEADLASRLEAVNGGCLSHEQAVRLAKDEAEAYALEVIGKAEANEDKFYHSGEVPATNEIELLLRFLQQRALEHGYKHGYLLLDGRYVSNKKDLFKDGRFPVFNLSASVYDRRAALQRDPVLVDLVLTRKLSFSKAAAIAQSKHGLDEKTKRSIQARPKPIDERVRR